MKKTWTVRWFGTSSPFAGTEDVAASDIGEVRRTWQDRYPDRRIIAIEIIDAVIGPDDVIRFERVR